MLETIKNIDPSKISDVQGLRAALTVLINAVEQLLQEKEEMKKEIQRLRDENNKLKGGTVRPVTKNPAKRDISSKGRERGNGEEAHEDKNLASSPIEIDSRLTCLVSPHRLRRDRSGETMRRDRPQHRQKKGHLFTHLDRLGYSAQRCLPLHY